MSLAGEIQPQNQGAAPPQPVVSSAPIPSFVPPEGLSPSQLPTPPDAPTPVMGQGQQPLLAGKYQTPQELERAYIESEQRMGQFRNEVGELRNQFFTMQQTLLQQQHPAPQAPTTPPVDPEQERARREYEALNPIVQQRIAQAGDQADEDQIWRDTLAEYQIAQVAAQMSMAPIQKQYQQAQETLLGNVGQQVLAQRVGEVFNRGGYQTIQPQQFLQMVGPSLNLQQFLGMPPQEQAQIIEMAANDLEMRNLRGAQAQQQLAQQYGIQTNGLQPPTMMPPNPYAVPQPVQTQPMPQSPFPTQPRYPEPFPSSPANYPPQYYPPGQAPFPLPYQGQVNPQSQVPYGQVPSTMAPTLPQGAPQYNPEYQFRYQVYTQTLGLPPERAARATQESLARDARGR